MQYEPAGLSLCRCKSSMRSLNKQWVSDERECPSIAHSVCASALRKPGSSCSPCPTLSGVAVAK